jgi:hypothetical protein
MSRLEKYGFPLTLQGFEAQNTFNKLMTKKKDNFGILMDN